MALSVEHLSDLKNSGLTDQIIESMAVYSMPPQELTRFIGKDYPEIESAMAFPYFDSEGTRNAFMRIKVFPAISDKDGHKIKYLQKKGSTPHLYILPQITEFLSDPKFPLMIIEGEKKTAKAVDSEFMAIGIGGLWSWVTRGKKNLITDWDAVNLWRREVLIVPDSDTWNKDQLQRAVFYLAKELRQRGATLRFKEIQ